MHAITTQEKIQQTVSELHKNKRLVGFVPTMGALHHGHQALIDFALEQCDHVVVSIFVNPTQFNNQDDFDQYPRSLERDLQFLQPYGDKVSVYAPSVEDIYADQVTATSYDFGGLEREMEGRYRPGHFEGVGTVLNRLFRIVKPDKAFFGEKDFQQLQIVRKLVTIENLPVEIIGAPIYRQADGLAMSSRNQRLSYEQLQKAPLIFQTLQQVQEDFGTKNVRALNEMVQARFDGVEGFDLEYFEIARESDLKTISRKQNKEKYRAFIAVFAGEVRLIDNIALN
ncbi:pantoate--beta-alanine ligase [Croceiramulus getboli]|nr:pantoate--beta-alanine ligase [Flavobacteriaceae bacterium YJPT1-3]